MTQSISASIDVVKLNSVWSFPTLSTGSGLNWKLSLKKKSKLRVSQEDGFLAQHLFLLIGYDEFLRKTERVHEVELLSTCTMGYQHDSYWYTREEVLVLVPTRVYAHLKDF